MKKRRGPVWTDEYKEEYFKSEKVQAHLVNFLEMSKQPKSEAQKAKMSQAAKGRAKSEQHRHNMAESHKFRQAVRREVLASNPDTPESEVWEIVRSKIKNNDFSPS